MSLPAGFGRQSGSSAKGIKKVFASGLTEVSTYDKEGVGAIRFEGRKIYKYVKYNQGSGVVAAVAGNMTYYMGGAIPVGHANSEVTSDLSDSVNIGAGVLQAVIPNGGFGWIQIAGEAVLTPALTAGADGNALTAVGATDGTLDVSALVTDFICAVAEDASLKKIILTCPF